VSLQGVYRKPTSAGFTAGGLMLALFIGIACASVGTIALILIFGDLNYWLILIELLIRLAQNLD
jgi:hypothetical protein